MAVRPDIEGCWGLQRGITVRAGALLAHVACCVCIQHHHIRVLFQDLDTADHLAAVHAVRPVGLSHRFPLFQYSSGSSIMVAEQSASVNTQMRSPVLVV